MTSVYFAATLAQLAYTVVPSTAEKERARAWATTSFTSRTPYSAISFNYDGVPSCELLQTWTREQTSEKLDERRSLHRLRSPILRHAYRYSLRPLNTMTIPPWNGLLISGIPGI